MKFGYLSDYFDGVAFKTLSAVEADASVSHQHEFNGVGNLVSLLGVPNGKERYDATFIYLTDDAELPVSETGSLTWYDAREKARIERGVMRTEYRLYFSENTVLQSAREGDLLIVAKQKKPNQLLVVVAEKQTTISSQLQWVFGLGEPSEKFIIRSEAEFKNSPLSLTTSFILNEIGVEPDIRNDDYLEDMIKRFNGKFPSTIVFSEYARSKVPEIDVYKNPDQAVVSYNEQEEILYRTLEGYLLSQKLKTIASLLEKGEGVDTFLELAMGTFNRRKARAGNAFENHLEYIFKEHNLRYSRGKITENKSKPDFVFPDIASYQDPHFLESNLTMLGVKTTCKDRWRQILVEADRIKIKHLITLEPRISLNQTDEMKQHKVELVIPKSIQSTYLESQRNSLLSLEDFIRLVKDRQKDIR